MTRETRPAVEISELVRRQRLACAAEGPVSEATRVARLQRVIDLLVKYRNPLRDAMGEDFGGRHPGYSLMNDVVGSLSCLKHSRDKCGEWMRPEPRPPFPPYDQMGAEAWVMYQPKGSIGIIGTWNAPLFTLFSPLADVFAAGNRAILKPSEIAPRTASVVACAVADLFDPLELAVVTGDASVAQVFTRQRFDHLVFTGSTTVARSVMRNAAENLVPLTLELGGKSPTIVGRSAHVPTVAFRLAAAKVANGGQLCVNPDVTYVPREMLEPFIAGLRSSFEQMLPRIRGNPEATAVVNTRHLARIEECVADAVRSGARVEVLSEDVPACDDDRRRPLRIVVDPPASTRIMREEIFGPAMVVVTYDRIEDAIADINGRPRPLALYYFGEDAAEQQFVLEHTVSGGVSINEAMFHAAMLDAPFGGIGESGMGHYHGREGFLEFSHARTVFKAGAYDPRREWGVLPPYGEHFLAAIDAQITP
ncbi:MAG: aldehyde dehydrogenase family protein [Steroidobacteraceae bacterium]